MKHNLWEKIPEKLDIHICYGICTDHNSASDFSYIIGFETPPAVNIPKGMAGKTIPASKYAVFTSKGKIPDSIINARRYIYSVWFPKSGFERSETEDFEVYDTARTNLKVPEVDIYIPIK